MNKLLGFLIIFIIITWFIASNLMNTGGSVIITNNTFECENNNSVQSRAYILLRGFGDHDPGSYDYHKDLISNDPKVRGVMDFDYNETTRLADLSQDFINEFNEFIDGKELEEVIIIGHSAGGTIAAYSAHKLEFNGAIEIHTLASPLKGCDFLMAILQFLIGRGYWRDAGVGLDQFTTPGDNVKVYHHKIINDEVLRRCGAPVEVQNNNVNGSKEFYYEEYGHSTIVPAVSKIIIECHE